MAEQFFGFWRAAWQAVGYRSTCYYYFSSSSYYYYYYYYYYYLLSTVATLQATTTMHSIVAISYLLRPARPWWLYRQRAYSHPVLLGDVRTRSAQGVVQYIVRTTTVYCHMQPCRYLFVEVLVTTARQRSDDALPLPHHQQCVLQ